MHQNRLDMEAQSLQYPLPAGVRHEAITIGQVSCEWAIPDDADPDTCIVYAHGGAFCVGSVISHRPLVSHIAKACGCAVIAVDYRLAPEHKFPAAADDVFTVYRAMLDTYRHIIPMGDSAGGSLAAGIPLQAREHGLPMPAGLVMLSPWLDLSCSARSFETNAASDPFMKRDGAIFVVRGYLKKADPCQPLASPVFADLHDFPPTLLQVSAQEVLLDDSTRFAERAEAAGVAVQLSVWQGVHHVWHFLSDTQPQAREAIAEIGRFVRSLTPPATTV
ncbi:MAG: alpha/beta hydrolase [Gammaproteobacteria bacterium]|nr:MAG: alpha/beta hydrolase [Gammaproteobacteria bacterium]